MDHNLFKKISKNRKLLKISLIDILEIIFEYQIIYSPAQCAGAHRAFWLTLPPYGGLFWGKRNLKPSVNQGQIPSATWWWLQVFILYPNLPKKIIRIFNRNFKKYMKKIMVKIYIKT